MGVCVARACGATSPSASATAALRQSLVLRSVVVVVCGGLDGFASVASRGHVGLSRAVRLGLGFGELVAELGQSTPVGEVLRILLEEVCGELEIALRERDLELASRCIFREVAGRRQAAIEREHRGGADAAAAWLEQISESPGRERRLRSVAERP